MANSRHSMCVFNQQLMVSELQHCCQTHQSVRQWLMLLFGWLFDTGLSSLSSTKHRDPALADLEEGPGDSALEHHPAAWRRLCHGQGLWGETHSRCHGASSCPIGLDLIRVSLDVLIWLWKTCINGVTTLKGRISQLQVTTIHSRWLRRPQLLACCLLWDTLRSSPRRGPVPLQGCRRMTPVFTLPFCRSLACLCG